MEIYKILRQNEKKKTNKCFITFASPLFLELQSGIKTRPKNLIKNKQTKSL